MLIVTDRENGGRARPELSNGSVMDPWPEYGPHYPCSLRGNLTPQDRLSVPPSLPPRQMAPTAYSSSTATHPWILPARRPPPDHANPAGGYAEFAAASSFQPKASPFIFKPVASKDADLRQGFGHLDRGPSPPPATSVYASHVDTNATWRHPAGIGGTAGPFGVLPHETVGARSDACREHPRSAVPGPAPYLDAVSRGSILSPSEPYLEASDNAPRAPPPSCAAQGYFAPSSFPACVRQQNGSADAFPSAGGYEHAFGPPYHPPTSTPAPASTPASYPTPPAIDQAHMPIQDDAFPSAVARAFLSPAAAEDKTILDISRPDPLQYPSCSLEGAPRKRAGRRGRPKKEHHVICDISGSFPTQHPCSAPPATDAQPTAQEEEEAAPSMRKTSTIEDDLGFLAHLPLGSKKPPCAGTVTPAVVPKPTRSTVGFLQSFMDFIQDVNPNSAAQGVTRSRESTVRATARPTVVLTTRSNEERVTDSRHQKTVAANNNNNPVNPVASRQEESAPPAASVSSEEEEEGSASSFSEEVGGTNCGPVSPTGGGQEEARGRRRVGGGRGRRAKRARRGEDEENGTGHHEQEGEEREAPRRTSMRRCKEQAMKQQQEKRELRSLHLGASKDAVADDDEEDDDFRLADSDSDCDPAWTPKDRDPEKSAKSVGSEDGRSRHSKRGRKKSATPAASSKKSAAAVAPKSASPQKKEKEEAPAPVKKEAATTKQQDGKQAPSNAAAPSPNEDESRFVRQGSFKTGDFVVLTEELEKGEDPPALWRIEGKSLIQRFEPIERDGERCYRNTSSYSSWNPSIRFKYSSATIRYVVCNRTFVVVKFLGVSQDGDAPPPPPANPRPRKDSKREPSSNGGGNAVPDPQPAIREHFEIFLQTLVSQALDPNFISEIMKEKDEYFLSHLNAMEQMASEKKKKLLAVGQWESLLPAIHTQPSLDVTEVPNDPAPCTACGQPTAIRVLQPSGFPYDETTLAPQDAEIKPSSLHFRACEACTRRACLYSQLHHQKYNFYSKCRDKVDSVRAGDESKASHVILEMCLQDAEWVNQMYHEMELLWQACDKVR